MSNDVTSLLEALREIRKLGLLAPTPKDGLLRCWACPSVYMAGNGAYKAGDQCDKQWCASNVACRALAAWEAGGDRERESIRAAWCGMLSSEAVAKYRTIERPKGLRRYGVLRVFCSNECRRRRRHAPAEPSPSPPVGPRTIGESKETP